MIMDKKKGKELEERRRRGKGRRRWGGRQRAWGGSGRNVAGKSPPTVLKLE